MVGARAFIKKLGIRTDHSLHRMRQQLLKSLNPGDQPRIEYIWAMRDAGLSSGLEQYLIPQNQRQAALLFASDWPRMEASFDWFGQVVSRSACDKIVDMGCGPGFLLRFLLDKFPGIKVQGIDVAENLVLIGQGLCDVPLITGDYLTAEPDDAYELIICNFGFDSPNFSPSSQPHSLAQCGAASYCPGCSDDLKVQLEAYTQSWRRWGTTKASLAITGRITDFGMLRAFALAAQDAGWRLSVGESTVLQVKNLSGEVERFPALLFRSSQELKKDLFLEDLAKFYVA